MGSGCGKLLGFFTDRNGGGDNDAIRNSVDNGAGANVIGGGGGGRGNDRIVGGRGND